MLKNAIQWSNSLTLSLVYQEKISLAPLVSKDTKHLKTDELIDHQSQ